jgi:hypothetical protein
VAFTSFTRAARMLARLTNRCRTRRSVASDSPCLRVTATRLIPMFVPSPNRTSSSRRRFYPDWDLFADVIGETSLVCRC